LCQLAAARDRATDAVRALLHRLAALHKSYEKSSRRCSRSSAAARLQSTPASGYVPRVRDQCPAVREVLLAPMPRLVAPRALVRYPRHAGVARQIPAFLTT